MLRVAPLLIAALLLCGCGNEVPPSQRSARGHLPVAQPDAEFPVLSRHIPHFSQRLRSPRWRVRYYLLLSLRAERTPETRRALEELAQDANELVANQALRSYAGRYTLVDRSLFSLHAYGGLGVFTKRLPVDRPERALVEYLLGRDDHGIDLAGVFEPQRLRPLDPSRADDGYARWALEYIGLFGHLDDVATLDPFLASSHDGVALEAARAAIRLGDLDRGRRTLRRLSESEPTHERSLVASALQALHEIGHPDLQAIARQAVAAVDAAPDLPPNVASPILEAAADALGDEVWAPR